jgi:DNA-binding transcriptional LysR family regulator
MRVAHGINVAQLRAFVAVVDERGFGSAADALGLTQSAVSHAIAALERTVGARVLHRNGAPTPTTLGQGILEHARAALAATEAIADLSAAEQGAPTGVIRLAAPPTVCQGLLPELVPAWTARFPRVTVRVFEGEEDEVTDWLSGHSVEAAVLVDPPHSTPGALLAADEFQVLLPTDHPLAGTATIELADLEGDPLLFSGGSCERPIHDLFRQANIRLRPTHHVRELSTLFAMVRSKMGITIVPSLVNSIIGDGLVLVPLRPTHQRRLVLTGPADNPWHPAVTALTRSLAPVP